MAKSEAGARVDAKPGNTPAPLSAGVRRHLGKNLRTVYADTLTAPVGHHLAALLARLEKASS